MYFERAVPNVKDSKNGGRHAHAKRCKNREPFRLAVREHKQQRHGDAPQQDAYPVGHIVARSTLNSGEERSGKFPHKEVRLRSSLSSAERAAYPYWRRPEARRRARRRFSLGFS